MASLADYQIDSVKSSFVVVTQATNAVATATKSAVAGRHHVVCKVDASYSSSSVSGELTVKFGTTVVARKHIHGAGAIDFGALGFQNPTVNDDVSAVLASGGVGIDGDITFTGYSTGPNA